MQRQSRMVTRMVNNQEPKTLLGFDFGMRSIGVAVGQTLTKTATPLTAIKANYGMPHWEQIDKLIASWKPKAIVVGEPLSEAGLALDVTKEARQFAQALKKRYNLPVYQINEHLTTIEARAQIFSKNGYKALKKSAVDAKSAQLILEDWLKQHSERA